MHAISSLNHRTIARITHFFDSILQHGLRPPNDPSIPSQDLETRQDPSVDPPTATAQIIFDREQEFVTRNVCNLFDLKMCYSDGFQTLKRPTAFDQIKQTLLSLELGNPIEGSLRETILRRHRVKAVLEPCVASKVDSLPIPEDSDRRSDRLVLRSDTRVERNFRISGEPWRLVSDAHYVVAHGDGRSEFGDYLVVVVADKDGKAAVVDSPVLAYMAMVHKNRQDRGDWNSVVYGISTNGYYFVFWTLDNMSRVFRSDLFDLSCSGNSDFDDSCWYAVALVQTILDRADEDGRDRPVGPSEPLPLVPLAD
ncbi:hypothetical protein BO71DRAFT_429924 [Aspergillus ellipticus CBS 707.79]|uniref:Uncharacterized protein n=1 Tax=Aspergillus ellipticus CBS 707.79 TaxID=1448320 RepID=A0A319DB57_9EURO|nr:hypothetical protein BO71DRAFT_429924 [Aspergillus ellipticus CBS 707.79]